MKEERIQNSLNMARRSWPCPPALLTALFFIFLFGCSSDLPTTVPVTGKITFGGGDCPAAGRIDFMPLEAAPGYKLRPGSAAFDTDGTFTVSSFDGSVGLVPGRYQSLIECWKTLPDEATGSSGESYVPAGHRLEELIVPADSHEPMHLDYDVPTS